MTNIFDYELKVILDRIGFPSSLGDWSKIDKLSSHPIRFKLTLRGHSRFPVLQAVFALLFFLIFFKLTIAPCDIRVTSTFVLITGLFKSFGFSFTQKRGLFIERALE